MIVAPGVLGIVIRVRVRVLTARAMARNGVRLVLRGHVVRLRVSLMLSWRVVSSCAEGAGRASHSGAGRSSWRTASNGLRLERSVGTGRSARSGARARQADRCRVPAAVRRRSHWRNRVVCACLRPYYTCHRSPNNNSVNSAPARHPGWPAFHGTERDLPHLRRRPNSEQCEPGSKDGGNTLNQRKASHGQCWITLDNEP